MPQIIDTLMLAAADTPSFTVNLGAGDTVSTNNNTGKILRTGSNQWKFQKGDSFQILSAGLVFPESFCPYGASSFLLEYLNAKDAALNLYSNPIFINGLVLFPMENQEYVLDVFFDTSISLFGSLVLKDTQFSLYLDNPAIPISQIGVPAAYDGKTFYVKPFFKILHNFVMV
jgi:hypothetical protein